MGLLRVSALVAAALATFVATPARSDRLDFDLPSLTDVFVSGQEGYNCYRIPAIISIPAPAAPSSASSSSSSSSSPSPLLAFAEGRRFSCADHGWNDIVAKRSTDGGLTWSPLYVVYGESTRSKNVTIGNPAPVVDTVHLSPTGTPRVLMPFSRNNVEAGVLVSEDLGKTFTMLATLPVPSDWIWVATGPPGSLQLLPSGRLIVPSDHQISGKPYYSHTYFSDDGGVTWNISATSIATGNECQAVQLPWISADTVLLTMRTTVSYRAAALSSDGGNTFGPMYPVYTETQCEGSVASLPSHPSGPLLVMSSAFDVSARVNMTLHTSTDSGKTWAAAVQVYPGDAAYSALVTLGTANVGLLFERDGYTKISYASISL
jgi:sialidase-1